MKLLKNASFVGLSVAVFVGTPLTALAANAPTFDYFQGAITSISGLIEQLIPVVIAIGLLFFIWGLVQFIVAAGDEDAKESGKRKIVWGIVALFVIVSVWGLVQLLNDLTGIEQGTGFTQPDTGL